MNFEIYMSEISKKTLGSYVSKSSENMADHVKARATAEGMHKATGSKESLDAARKHDDMRAKRSKGIMKAVKKLSEDVELTESIEEALEELLSLNGIEFED